MSGSVHALGIETARLGSASELLIAGSLGQRLLIYVEHGEGCIELRTGRMRVAAGDFVVSDVDFTKRPVVLRECTGWSVGFMPEAAMCRRSASMGRSTPTPPHLARRRDRWWRWKIPAGRRDQWSRWLGELDAELARADSDCGPVAWCLLRVVLECSELLRAGEVAQDDDAFAHPVVREVVETVDAHLAEAFRVADMARVVACSSRQLRRIVRANTGRSVMELVEERRMRAARSLLARTDDTVAAIASSMGYHDVGYFRRRFRKMHGVAPRVWRSSEPSVIVSTHTLATPS